jgi:hypothetical protein
MALCPFGVTRVLARPTDAVRTTAQVRADGSGRSR